jgi:hypothetical protein
MFLLHQIENHLRLTQTPAARFGRDALGDPRFVFDLRAGREPRLATVRRVLSYMEKEAKEAERLAASAPETPQNSCSCRCRMCPLLMKASSGR